MKVVWRDWLEWGHVYELVFGSRVPETPRKFGKICAEDGWRSGLDRLRIWRARSTELPVMVEATLELLECLMSDWDGANSYVQRLAYGMCVTRVVNFASDPMQDGVSGFSILDRCIKIGIPRWVVDVRHEVTHQTNLVTLEMLRLSVDALFGWIKEYYWDRQAGLLIASDKEYHEANKMEIKFDDTLSGDEMRDYIDSVVEAIPFDLMERVLVPKLVHQVLLPKEDCFLLERLLAGLADGYHHQGLSGAIVNYLCSMVLQAKKPQFVQECLRWIQYFVSRRWHSLGNHEIARYGDAKLELSKIHPSKWTPDQREWMLQPGPARLQDVDCILKHLRVAFQNPTEPSTQRLIHILVPAIITEKSNIRERGLTHAMHLYQTKIGANKNVTMGLHENALTLSQASNLLVQNHSSSPWEQVMRIPSQDQEQEEQEQEQELEAEEELEIVVKETQAAQEMIEAQETKKLCLARKSKLLLL